MTNLVFQDTVYVIVLTPGADAINISGLLV